MPASSERFHGLDALRAVMMLLGVWLHASCSYSTLAVAEWWPYRDAQTSLWFTIPIVFIHLFRMPVFFLLAGFFGRLVWERRGTAGFAGHRAARILLPFVLFWPVLFVLSTSGFTYGQFLSEPDPWASAMRFYTSGEFLGKLNTIHLWFLHYLVHFYVAAVIGIVLLPRLVGWERLDRVEVAFRRLIEQPLRPLIFAIPTALTLFAMKAGALETSTGFWLQPKSVAAYGVFFLFGWMLYRQRDVLPTFQRGAWMLVAISVPLAVVNMGASARAMRALPAYSPRPHTVAVLTGAIAIWLLIFGLMGLFLKYLDGPRPWMRYLSDASYWIYLVHFPLVIWIPVLLARTPVPAALKFAIVLAVAAPVLVLTYRYAVRNTVIGVLLNGSRRPASSAA